MRIIVKVAMGIIAFVIFLAIVGAIVYLFTSAKSTTTTGPIVTIAPTPLPTATPTATTTPTPIITGQTGQEAIQIQSVAFSNGVVQTVYLQNVGDTTVTIIPNQCLYINGALDTGATASSTSLSAGNTATITTSSNQSFTPGQEVTIKVTTEDGTFSQITEQAP